MLDETTELVIHATHCASGRDAASAAACRSITFFGTARRKPSLAVIAEGSETAAAIAEGGLYIAARSYSARRRYAQCTEIVQLRLSCTIVIERIESPSLGGFPFGTDGQYATIVVTPLAKSTLELQFLCQALWLEHTTENRDHADRQKRT